MKKLSKRQVVVGVVMLGITAVLALMGSATVSLKDQYAPTYKGVHDIEDQYAPSYIAGNSANL